jgi:hypothetical protein
VKRTVSRWINAYYSCSMVIKSCPLLMKDSETCVGSSLASYFVLFSLISFCFRWFRFISSSFRWFRFVSFRFCWFRFVSFRFVSFSLISFRFVSFLFRFALYRYPTYLMWKPISLFNFDLESFRQWWKDWSFRKGMYFICKHIFVGIHTPIDKHILHSNIVSNPTRNFDILS